MIKRLFRKWLRFHLCKKFGEHTQNFEQAYNWVYYSPMKEWKTRIRCVSQCWSQTTTPTIVGPITKIDMNRAVELFYAIKEQSE